MKNPTPATELAIIRSLAESGAARETRLRTRLSLAEVAAQCGTDTGTVQRWETGQRRPRGDAGLKYARLIQELAALDLGTETRA